MFVAEVVVVLAVTAAVVLAELVQVLAVEFAELPKVFAPSPADLIQFLAFAEEEAEVQAEPRAMQL